MIVKFKIVVYNKRIIIYKNRYMNNRRNNRK